MLCYLLDRFTPTATISGVMAPFQGLFHFWGLMNRRAARLRYNAQKQSASRRGIEWEFTFDEWCEIWEPHWDERGPKDGGKVMCRTADKGPYRPDNVRIDSTKANAQEYSLERKCARAAYWYEPRRKSYGLVDSHASRFPRPDRALEMAQEEYEWIPGE